jgi:hypothetical protein
MKKNLTTSFCLLAVLALVFALTACGGGSSDDITLSGVVVDTEDGTVANVSVTLMDGATGLSLGVSDVSAGDGSYYLVGLPSGEPFYVNMTATGYVPTNTEIHTITSSQDDAYIMIVDLTTADALVDTIHTETTWAAVANSTGFIGVDIYDTNGDDAGGYSVTPDTALDEQVYNDGDGTFDGGDSYTNERASGGGPMVLGYDETNVDSLFSFDAQGCGTVYNYEAWIKAGEVTIINFWGVEDAC